MSTKTIHIERISREEWVRIWLSSEYATFFEHPDWFDAWEIMYSGSVDPFAIKITDVDRESYVIPCFKRNLAKGLLSKYECSPGGLYAGPLGINGQLSELHIQSLKKILEKELTDFSFRLNPFILPVKHPISTGDLFTQVVDFAAQGDFSENLRQNGVAYDARYAQRKGLRIQLESKINLINFFQVYESIRLSWDHPGTYYPVTFFEKLTSSHLCDVWSVLHNDDYIGGGILLKGPKHVSSWLTIMHPDSRSLRPYEFAYNHLLNHYADKGFRYFDFNPSAGLEGVVKFKEKFGTSKISYAQLENQGKMNSVLVALRGVKS